MSSLRSRNGPRIKYVAEEGGPYDTITVDKLTPIIGGEIGGVDLVAAARQPHPRRDPSRAGREFGDLLPRPAPDRGSASGVRPAVRRTAHPSGGTLGARQARIDDHPCRQGFAHAPMARAGTATCRAIPSRRWAASSISGQCPPHGGDTLFASMYAAYEALSDRMKSLSRRADRASITASTIAANTPITASRTRRAIPLPTTRSCAPIR